MSNAPSVLIAIDIADPRWLADIADVEASVTRAARAAFVSGADAGLRRHPGVEAGVLLSHDAELRTLNNDYRDKDQPTNVLAFPAFTIGDPPPTPEMPLLLGDIAISYDTARGEAGEERKALEDHLCHLVVHGMLHLLGFDHQSEAQAADMERLEIAVLGELGIANPYDDNKDPDA